MKCLFPRTIYAPEINYETGEISKNVPKKVPCGKCYYCLATKRGHWISRLEEEKKTSHSAHFVTLTYSEEFMPIDKNGNPMLVKEHVQKFMKRLRKRVNEKIRFFCVGEYGPHTQRPHYHLIIFNLGVIHKSDRVVYTDLSDVQVEVQRSWSKQVKDGYIPFGYSSVYPLNDRMISYVCKYHCIPKDVVTPENFVKPFSLMSRRPGIGEAYIEKNRIFHNGNIFHHFYPAGSGTIRSLPRYYSERLYDELLRFQRGQYLAEFNNTIVSQKTKKEVHDDFYHEVDLYNDFERKQLKSLKDRHKI